MNMNILSTSNNTSTSNTSSTSSLLFLSSVGTLSKNFVAGTIAGACECIVGHPLDTIKARLQTEGICLHQFNGPWDCIRSTIKHEGVFALYRGVSSAITRSALSTSVLFGVMGYFKHLFEVDHQQNIFSTQLLAAACCTGLIEGLVYNPLEIIKIRMQTNYGRAIQETTWQCAKDIFRHHGIKNGLYRGFRPLALREMLGNVSYFGAYEYSKEFFLQNNRKSDNTPILNSPQQEEKNLIIIASAGGIAGVAYWFSVFPIDTIKAIIQADSLKTPRYNGMLDCGAQIIQKHGILRLYKGLSPSLIRAIPANAVTFVIFESCLKIIETWIEEQVL